MQKENAIQILVQVAEMAQKNGLFDLKAAVTVSLAIDTVLQPEVAPGKEAKKEPILEKVADKPAKPVCNPAARKR